MFVLVSDSLTVESVQRLHSAETTARENQSEGGNRQQYTCFHSLSSRDQEGGIQQVVVALLSTAGAQHSAKLTSSAKFLHVFGACCQYNSTAIVPMDVSRTTSLGCHESGGMDMM